MQPDFQRLMKDATRLTSQGDLDAALAAIQAALGNGSAPAAHTAARNAGVVIDVEARVVPESDGPALQPPPPNGPVPEPAARAPSTAEPRPTPTRTEEAFVSGRFGGQGAAGRNYKLYIPPGAGDAPLPLVVMLHGCTQNPDDFAAGTGMNAAARTQGFYVLYPEQSKQTNPQHCWNWFKHTHQQRGRGEPALIAGMVGEVMRRHRIDKDRVYVAGLSAGGAMAAILGETYPDLFAAVGVHSGLPAGAARDLPSALDAMKKGTGGRARNRSLRPVPTIVIHGDADRTVHPVNGEQVIWASTGDGGVHEAETVHAPQRRRATRRVHRDAGGRVVAEHWVVHGAPHAWSGGTREGSYTDPQGPDATAAMVRFFMDHPRA